MRNKNLPAVQQKGTKAGPGQGHTKTKTQRKGKKELLEGGKKNEKVLGSKVGDLEMKLASSAETRGRSEKDRLLTHKANHDKNVLHRQGNRELAFERGLVTKQWQETQGWGLWQVYS